MKLTELNVTMYYVVYYGVFLTSVVSKFGTGVLYISHTDTQFNYGESDYNNLTMFFMSSQSSWTIFRSKKH